MAQKFVAKSKGPLRILNVFELPEFFLDFRHSPENLPADWDEFCDNVQEDCHIAILTQARKRLYFHLYCYIHAAHHEAANPSATNVKKRIRDLAKESKKLRLMLASLEDENPYTILPTLRDNSRGKREVDKLPPLLNELEHSCESILTDFSRHIEGGPGPAKYPSFAKFVLQVGIIFKKSGGKASANFSANYAAEAPRFSPFVRFCWVLAERLPSKNLRPSTRAAFGVAIYRALKVPSNDRITEALRCKLKSES